MEALPIRFPSALVVTVLLALLFAPLGRSQVEEEFQPPKDSIEDEEDEFRLNATAEQRKAFQRVEKKIEADLTRIYHEIEDCSISSLFYVWDCDTEKVSAQLERLKKVFIQLKTGIRRLESLDLEHHADFHPRIRRLKQAWEKGLKFAKETFDRIESDYHRRCEQPEKTKIPKNPYRLPGIRRLKVGRKPASSPKAKPPIPNTPRKKGTEPEKKKEDGKPADNDRKDPPAAPPTHPAAQGGFGGGFGTLGHDWNGNDRQLLGQLNGDWYYVRRGEDIYTIKVVGRKVYVSAPLNPGGQPRLYVGTFKNNVAQLTSRPREIGFLSLPIPVQEDLIRKGYVFRAALRVRYRDGALVVEFFVAQDRISSRKKQVTKIEHNQKIEKVPLKRVPEKMAAGSHSGFGGAQVKSTEKPAGRIVYDPKTKTFYLLGDKNDKSQMPIPPPKTVSKNRPRTTPWRYDPKTKRYKDNTGREIGPSLLFPPPVRYNQETGKFYRGDGWGTPLAPPARIPKDTTASSYWRYDPKSGKYVDAKGESIAPEKLFHPLYHHIEDHQKLITENQVTYDPKTKKFYTSSRFGRGKEIPPPLRLRISSKGGFNRDDFRYWEFNPKTGKYEVRRRDNPSYRGSSRDPSIFFPAPPPLRQAPRSNGPKSKRFSFLGRDDSDILASDTPEDMLSSQQPASFPGFPATDAVAFGGEASEGQWLASGGYGVQSRSVDFVIHPASPRVALGRLPGGTLDFGHSGAPLDSGIDSDLFPHTRVRASGEVGDVRVILDPRGVVERDSRRYQAEIFEPFRELFPFLSRDPLGNLVLESHTSMDPDPAVADDSDSGTGFLRLGRRVDGPFEFSQQPGATSGLRIRDDFLEFGVRGSVSEQSRHNSPWSETAWTDMVVNFSPLFEDAINPVATTRLSNFQQFEFAARHWRPAVFVGGGVELESGILVGANLDLGLDILEWELDERQRVIAAPIVTASDHLRMSGPKEIFDRGSSRSGTEVDFSVGLNGFVTVPLTPRLSIYVEGGTILFSGDREIQGVFTDIRYQGDPQDNWHILFGIEITGK